MLRPVPEQTVDLKMATLRALGALARLRIGLSQLSKVIR